MANMYNMAAMYNPFDRRAHSSYPRVPFHTIRFFQLISSLAVLVFVSWFIWVCFVLMKSAHEQFNNVAYKC